ncbi:MAG: DUF5683 domain-containing protein [Flavobacteriales bacterium]
MMTLKSFLLLYAFAAVFSLSLHAQVEEKEIIEKDTLQSVDQIKGFKGAGNQGFVTQVSKTEKGDESSPNSEKAKKETRDSLYHSPRKATMLSAVLPGAGQFYNKKYWKIPIVYAGFGALAYSVGFNQQNYRFFKDELIRRQQGIGGLDPDLERYSNANLDELQSFYRRNRDLSFIGIALLYVVNIIDSTVDAHLFEFDMSDDLSLKWNGNQGDLFATSLFQPRLTLSFRF